LVNIEVSERPRIAFRSLDNCGIVAADSQREFNQLMAGRALVLPLQQRAMAHGVCAHRSASLPQAHGRRWVIYLRNSKTRKKMGQLVTVSLDVQEQFCRQAILRHDPQPASISVVKDEGRSGGGGRRRPGRDLLLDEVAAGRLDVRTMV
jgi:hypothetical protein